MILTVGNFDGLHRGHQFLIQKVVSLARRYKKKSCLLTFWPHPSYVLASLKPVPLLFPLYEQKKQLLKKWGLDYVIIQPFTKAFAKLSPQEFIEDYIVKKYKPSVFCVGENFRFGFQGRGDKELLKHTARAGHFKVNMVRGCEYKGKRISSSQVRQGIAKGKWDLVSALLGRFFAFQGKVVRGKGRGKKMGFPTLNLKCAREQILPQRGVYLTRVKRNKAVLPAVMNIGWRPTFSSLDGNKKSYQIEVHLLKGGDLWKTGQWCEVEVLKPLRKEKKFPTVEKLTLQIQKDTHQAREFFLNPKNFIPGGV